MFIHNVEHYAGILKNKVDLYAFVWKELQDIKLKKKKVIGRYIQYDPNYVQIKDKTIIYINT